MPSLCLCASRGSSVSSGKPRPPPAVVPVEAAAEELEEQLQVAGALGAVEDGERPGAEGRGHFAGVVAPVEGALDDEDRGVALEPEEKVEQARAGLFGGGKGGNRWAEG